MLKNRSDAIAISKYKKMIIEQIEKEMEISEEREREILTRLNSAELEELERLYDAFERFGVKTIIDTVEQRSKNDSQRVD